MFNDVSRFPMPENPKCCPKNQLLGMASFISRLEDLAVKVRQIFGTSLRITFLLGRADAFAHLSQIERLLDTIVSIVRVGRDPNVLTILGICLGKL